MRWIFYAVAFLLAAGAAGAGAVLWVFHAYGRGLPDYRQLADHQPPVTTRVHGGDGRLLAEYATERRIFVPVGAIPKRVSRAFLAAEDSGFHGHSGVDFVSLAGAALANIRNYGSGRRPRGASTITQQVAKNFLLTNEVSIERKIKEAILAFRIERALTKDRILELYLNEIYLGFGSYGVAAAALNYFDKPLDELTVAEAAYLAALPKAPNNYHPTRRRAAALARRNWVVGRMAETGAISPAEAEAARASPLEIRPRLAAEFVEAPFFAEEVRRELMARFGERGLYGGGLSVRATVDPRLQRIADRALRDGLARYDRKHGWRGPAGSIAPEAGWEGRLAAFGRPPGLPADWRVALTLEVGRAGAGIGFADGGRGTVPLEEMRWARPWREGQRLGPKLESAAGALAPGDVVFVEPAPEAEADAADGAGAGAAAAEGGAPEGPGRWALRQIPDVGGALVALDPHTGRVLAMSGGWDFALSEFNRATQARRQPGSAFKPFVYMAALDSGYTPATRILDAPFVIDQGPGLGKWKPANYTRKFHGPSTMRLGIEKSRNLMTVRLARTVGMERVAEYARRFGVVEEMAPRLAMSLGAGETTLLDLTAAYAMLVNGGGRIVPTTIDRIQDRDGRVVFRHDDRPCEGCAAALAPGAPVPPVPRVPDRRERVADAASAYQMVRMLEGVVRRGTGRRIAELARPLAGKTGTSNDAFDAWFVGFSPDLAAGVWVGFDAPRTLGPRESGSSVAVPIFKAFMADALADSPRVPFRAPPGVLHVRIDAATGAPARPGDRNVIVEAFKPGTQPTRESRILDGAPAAPPPPGAPARPVAASSGGLY